MDDITKVNRETPQYCFSMFSFVLSNRQRNELCGGVVYDWLTYYYVIWALSGVDNRRKEIKNNDISYGTF